MRLSTRALALPMALLASLVAVALGPVAASAQDRRDEQFYYPGRFNWRFLARYPEAARLFNAFDYGHAVLYEKLLTDRERAGAALAKEYRYLTTDLLVRPPRLAIAEEAVMPSYAKEAWRAKQMFDWAHVLHRQIYDVYADERLTMVQKDSLIERLTDYYLSRKAYAFPAVPKSMELMEGQYFSRAFRRAYPEFNGLIWAYHWLQVGLYEPFLEPGIPAETKAGVKATLARFWSMLEEPPSRMPKLMPMTSAIAPRFSQRHRRAAAIFDNLHMMHDIISDILVADTVPQEKKREVIYAQLDELQDTTSHVMPWDEWRTMADMMGGVAVMGGSAARLLAGVHAPVTPSPSMKGMEHGAMAHGKPHEMTPMQHPGADSAHMRRTMDLHMRMMADSTIRRRVMADTAMHRLMMEMMAEMPAPRPRTPEAKDSAAHHGHQK